MKLRNLSLTLLLFLTAAASPSLAALSCSTLLNKKRVIIIDHPNSILRNPKQFTLKGQNEALIKSYEEHIVNRPKNLEPHTRSQCLGSCYIYSGVPVVENWLKRNSLIPEKSVILTLPFLSAVADQRKGLHKTLTSARQVIDNGTIEVFHSLNDKFVFFFSPETIERLGGAEEMLDLEKNFLDVFVDYQTFKFQGKTFLEHLNTPSIEVEWLMVRAFQAHVKLKKKFTPPVETLRVNHLEYTHAFKNSEDQGVYYVGSITTSDEVTVRDVDLRFGKASEASVSLPNDAFRRVDTDLQNITIPHIVKTLKNGGLVQAYLSPLVFNGAHGVTITNLVVNKFTQELIGFIYLNSNDADLSENNKGFLHAAEAAKYITGFTTLDDIITEQ